jgi:hypothetical protein
MAVAGIAVAVLLRVAEGAAPSRCSGPHGRRQKIRPVSRRRPLSGTGAPLRAKRGTLKKYFYSSYYEVYITKYTNK